MKHLLTAAALVLLVVLPAAAQTRAAGNQPPRTADGKPDLSGIWQALNDAAWDIQDHNSMLFGHLGVPPGRGIVEGNEIPYKPDALAQKKMKPAGIEKFEGNDVDVVPQLSRLKSAGTDVLFLVGNVGPSSQVVKSLDRMGWMPPIVSHWGPAGGRFTELAGPSAKNVHFVQTYSFFGKQSPVGQKVLKALMAKYPDIKGAGDVTPAVGVANAYDSLMLSALAIRAAGSTDGPKVRDGYYKIGKYEGLIKTYDKPFTPQNHDALSENDYVWAQFIDNQILPVGMSK
jgi:branched-chain amino acid transport system substrate-binding protein